MQPIGAHLAATHTQLMRRCVGVKPVMHVHSIPNIMTTVPNCSRELITSEIVYWLYQVLTGKDAEFLSWPAAASFHTQRKQMRPGVGTLQDWVQDLLKKIVFKVSQFHLPVPLKCCSIQHQALCSL